MARFQSLLNLLPAGGFIGQRKGSKLGFLWFFRLKRAQY